MAASVKIEGLRELEASLAQLPKATGRNTLRRVLKLAAEPIKEAARAKAPVDTDPASSPGRAPGTLRDSIIVGTKLTKRQARDAKKETKAFSEIHVGTSDPAGVLQEFGTFKEPAQPFMRPAWEGNKDNALKIIGDQLGTEIEKSAARLARKAARLAAKG